MNAAKVFFSNGDSLVTSIAGSFEDIKSYYKPGKSFNIGRGEDDLLVKVVRCEVFELLEEYKGYNIYKWEGHTIVVADKEAGLNHTYIVAWDDSKKYGQKTFIEDCNNIESAKEYIDWVTAKIHNSFTS